MKRATLCFAAVLLAVGWLTIPAQAQSCNGFFCFLTASCTSCTVNQTITFELECEDEVPPEICEEEPPSECECDLFPDLNAKQYFVGYKWVGGTWVQDANCVEADNPLMYTFQSGDVGTYRRSACRDSSCTECSSNEVQITVSSS